MIFHAGNQKIVKYELFLEHGKTPKASSKL